MARLEGDRSSQFTPNAIKKATIESVNVELEKFRDVYLVIELLPEDSQYTERAWIVGDFERGTDGTVKANWLINKINDFLDVIDYSGGYNIRGEFEDPAGIVVPKSEVGNVIMEHITRNNLKEIYAYFYKEWDEVDNKAYGRVFQPFAKLTDKEKLLNKVTRLIEIGKKNPKKGIVPYEGTNEQPKQSKYTYDNTNGGIPKI